MQTIDCYPTPIEPKNCEQLGKALNKDNGMQTQPTVLIIGYVWPEPKSSAAGTHMLSLLECLQSMNSQITFASPAQRGEHSLDLEAQGVDSQDIVLNDSSFDEFVAELQPTIVIFDRFMMEEQFAWRVERVCPEAMRVLDTEDLFCLRHARHALQKETNKDKQDTQSITTEISNEELFSELAQREIAALYRCDLSLVISEVEFNLLRERFGIDPALLVYFPLLVEAQNSANAPSLGFEEREDFIAIGNFRHPPNWDAVLWLKESLWPEIRKQLPQAKLNIYGAYTPPKATALHNPAQGFLVKGWVEDAFEVTRQAKVNLAPIRFGAGLKGKIMDAMVCGTPTVTTPIGAEGIAGGLPFAGDIGANPEVLVQQAVKLYTDQQHWQDAQAQGFDIIQQRFDKETHLKHLSDALQNTLENLSAHRTQNFIGAMMRHHHHKSSQYMGQWIEAKNKLNKEES